jgi:hypothetical protein
MSYFSPLILRNAIQNNVETVKVILAGRCKVIYISDAQKKTIHLTYFPTDFTSLHFTSHSRPFIVSVVYYFIIVVNLISRLKCKALWKQIYVEITLKTR